MNISTDFILNSPYRIDYEVDEFGNTVLELCTDKDFNIISGANARCSTNEIVINIGYPEFYRQFKKGGFEQLAELIGSVVLHECTHLLQEEDIKAAIVRNELSIENRKSAHEAGAYQAQYPGGHEEHNKAQVAIRKHPKVCKRNIEKLPKPHLSKFNKL